MSTARDPTVHALDDCGCCGGLGRETPQVVHNRPGLSSIAYRVGTHSGFKASMLARLSAAELGALRRLTTRADDDLTIALLDSWAAVADVVTFYQERIANESYLRTATERRSLVELADLIGYAPRPGVAASVHLAFTVDQAGPPGAVPVPAGTRVQSVPGPGERPQVFETVEAIAGRPEWNAIRPLLVQTHPALTPATRTVTVRGTTTSLRKGDTVLLLCGGGAANRVVLRVVAVTADPAARTTRVDLDEQPPRPPPFRRPPVTPAPWRPEPVKLTSAAVAANVLSGGWRQADLAAYVTVQGWSVAELSAHLAVQSRKRLTKAPPETGVFALRQRAAVFGHNAPNYLTMPANVIGGRGWEGRTLDQEPGGRTNQVDLDTTYPEIVAGGWLVLQDAVRPDRTDVYKVTGATELSRADFTMAARVSRVTVSSSTGFDKYPVRTTAVLAQSEALELAEVPITDVVAGNRLVLDGPYLGLTVGRPVAVSGTRTDLDGVTGREVVTLAEVTFSAGVTELVFATSLAHEYERATVTVNANVAMATHGESRNQVLGSGDAGTPFQRFVLPESPLTHVPARTSTGAASTLSIRVDELLWHEVDSLYARGPDDRVYVTHTDDEGQTWVQFGDGRTGARLPTGVENVRASYRKGMGAEGMVERGQLTHLLTKPLGVRSVTNPVAAADAADAESASDVRRNAALPIRTLDRIVSLRDYEDFARAFTGIAKALATWTWNGHQRGVFVTVAGADGAAVAASGALYQNVLAAIRQAGDAMVPLRVKSYTPAFFSLAATVGVGPEHQPDRVLAEVETALRAAYSFEGREFGQPVVKSHVIATIQSVAGVVGVDLDELQRVDAAVRPGAPVLADRLPARLPLAGTDVTVAAELLLLDPRPVRLRLMTP